MPKKSDPSGGKKAANKPKRGARGAFLPGNKEGVYGRPKGSRNITTRLIESLLEGEAEDLTRALIARAKKGYAVPLQIVFDRIAPPRKDRHVEITLPPIETAQDVFAAQSAVIAEVAAGGLTPHEAAAIVGLLAQTRQTIEAVELEMRLNALEQRLAESGGPP
jgi:hypothetical protein